MFLIEQIKKYLVPHVLPNQSKIETTEQKDQMQFQALFYPESIAVIGASRREKTVGNDVVRNLVNQGYTGKIYPVNPKATELYGKKVYSAVAEIPTKIDLAVLAIPAKNVLAEIQQAHEKGVKAVIIISSGFKEIGEVKLEKEISDFCRNNEILLVGPNCLGVINSEIKMNASFAALMPQSGNVAFISQSGALCTAVLDYAQDLGIGFSKFVSIGNKAGLDELALIKYFFEDPKTQVIALYTEQLADAAQFINLVRSINNSSQPKPIIVLKSGRTELGSAAIASHTGSLSSGDSAYTALFDQAGIIRADNIGQLFDYVQIFSKTKLAIVNNVAVITNAGGPGVLTTDELVTSGLKMAELTEKTVTALKQFLPVAANTHNPIDVLGDAVAERYEQTLELVITDQNVDAVLLILTPQSMTDIVGTAQAIINIKRKYQKPIAVSFMGKQTVHNGVELLRKANVVINTFPESAAKALAIFGQFSQLLTAKQTSSILKYDDVDYEKVKNIFAQAKKSGKHSFPEAEAIEILKAYNFPLLKTIQVTTANEAYEAIKKMGETQKYAMKIVSQDILHKSDVGGVMLNVMLETVKEKFTEMMQVVAHNKPEAKLDGVLLMEMAPNNGIEVILGVNKAPGLGTMVMVGLGGIYVEVLKDVNFGFVPLTEVDATRMVETLRSAKLFAGVRGQKPADKAMLIESIGRLAQLVTDFPEINELDINPLLVLPQGEGVKALDARVVIE